MSVHTNLSGNAVSKLKANNFIVCITEYNLAALDSTINQIEEGFTSAPSCERELCIGAESKETKQSFVGERREGGGTILCLIDPHIDVETNQLRDMLHKKSKVLKERGVCLNAIIHQVCCENLSLPI